MQNNFNPWSNDGTLGFLGWGSTEEHPAYYVPARKAPNGDITLFTGTDGRFVSFTGLKETIDFLEDVG